MIDEPSPPSAARSRPKRSLNWVAVAGFGALGLLWPLLRLLGLESVLGGFPTALIAFFTTMLVWVLGAGFGGVPRPVLTLTLSGAAFAVVMILTSVWLGDWPDYGLTLNIVAGVVEVGRAAGLGALTGVLAEYLQRWHRRRSRR